MNSIKMFHVFKYVKYSFLKRQLSLQVFDALKTDPSLFPRKCKVEGWIKSLRKRKTYIFIDLDDGLKNYDQKLQIVLPEDKILNQTLSLGASIIVEGNLVKSSHLKQNVEMQGESLTVLKECPHLEFPLKLNQKYPLDYLRFKPHLKPRNPLFSALLRVRSSATFHIHQFFMMQNCINIQCPVLTINDCEGAGEVFSVQPLKKLSSEKKDDFFFGKPTFLTVSSQLELEAAAGAMKQVYSFGPAFRAENTRTSHHLSEFQMIEVELSFIDDVEVLISFFEKLVVHVGKALFETNEEDILVLQKECAGADYSSRIRKALDKPFVRMSYTEAVETLQKHKNKLQNEIKWGDDLMSEHELFLVQLNNESPVVITNFPAEVKPFYMKKESKSGTNSTALCFDVLMPYGAEVCGGSLRENDFQMLKSKLDKLGITETLSWYLDLRKYGSAPHGGFGAGFDRLLQYYLGIRNIRDVVPFPRWVHH